MLFVICSIYSFIAYGSKWTVQKGKSGRSLKWSVARKWTVLRQTGQSFEPCGRSWVKIDGHSTKSVSFGTNKTVKLDGPKVSNCMARKCQTESVNVDSPRIFGTQSANFPYLHPKPECTDPNSSGRTQIAPLLLVKTVKL